MSAGVSPPKVEREKRFALSYTKSAKPVRVFEAERSGRSTGKTEALKRPKRPIAANQRTLIREKFGRDPGPKDPVFFDSNASEPREMLPLDPNVNRQSVDHSFAPRLRSATPARPAATAAAPNTTIAARVDRP